MSETLIVTSKWTVRVTEPYVVHAIFLLKISIGIISRRLQKSGAAKVIVYFPKVFVGLPGRLESPRSEHFILSSMPYPPLVLNCHEGKFGFRWKMGCFLVEYD